MILYIAGPMTGYPNHNYPAFNTAAEQLTNAGYETLNPARPDGRCNCETWADFMRASLLDLAKADAIAILPGWSASRGATLEHRIGTELGIPIATVDHWVADPLHAGQENLGNPT